jgi:TolB-like protein
MPRWPCLLPSMVVGVAPLRNLTGEADRQGLVEGVTDCLVADLFRHCRGLSFTWVADERRYADNLPPRNPPQLTYVVYGSVQRGSYGMLRVNLRISDAITADYLWAGRQEFRPEDVAQIQTEMIRQISRVLHVLLLHEASRRAVTGLDAGLEVDECLTRAETELKGGMRAEISAEAQRWFLAALAEEPLNVASLSG